jgi:hypothetical protein
MNFPVGNEVNISRIKANKCLYFCTLMVYNPAVCMGSLRKTKVLYGRNCLHVYVVWITIVHDVSECLRLHERLFRLRGPLDKAVPSHCSVGPVR